MSEDATIGKVNENDKLIYDTIERMQDHEWHLFNAYDRKASGLLATAGMLFSTSIAIEFYLFKSLELMGYSGLVLIFFVPTAGCFLLTVAYSLLCLNINYFHHSPSPPHLIGNYAEKEYAITLVDIANASTLAWTRNHGSNHRKFRYTRLAFISLGNGLGYMIVGLLLSGYSSIIGGG